MAFKIKLPPGTLASSCEPRPPIDPICESAIGRLWVLFRTERGHPLVASSGLVVRMLVFGRYQSELADWDRAGRPHVCGRFPRDPPPRR